MSTNPKILTVCYPWKRIVREDGSFLDEVMLGVHNNTEGAQALHMGGKLNGPGGKFNPDTDLTIAHCDERGVSEEFGIQINRDRVVLAGIVNANNNGKMATIYFSFVDEWTGEPRETREFREIGMYNITRLPSERMMDADAKYALPLMLHSAMMRGEILHTDITHNENMIVTSCTKFTYTRRP